MTPPSLVQPISRWSVSCKSRKCRLTASLCVSEVAKYHSCQNSVANKSEIESARPSVLRFVGHIIPVAAILCWLGDYTISTARCHGQNLSSNLLTNGLSLVLTHLLMSARPHELSQLCWHQRSCRLQLFCSLNSKPYYC